MKKVILAFMLLFACANYTNAQDVGFGLTAGYLNTQEKLNTSMGDISENFSGFYVGAFADIGINEVFHIQPGVNYGNVEETSLLYIPIMAKYYIGDSGFSLQAGPQGTLILEESMEGLDNFGIDIAAGAAYDITENFFIEARYAFELTDRFSSDVDSDDAEYKINNLFVGVGYKF